MPTTTVETWQDGVLIDTREVEVADVQPDILPVYVDAQALTDAQAAISKATTIAGLKQAVAAALDLLNPAT